MKCFVISPIGESGSETRKQSDDVLEHIINEALRPFSYDIERADTIAESGLITSQIIERITTVDLVIADLSRHNANVFYELAIRHVTGKPFIQLIEQSQKIPFDVANSRTIQYSLDLSGAKKAREELTQQVRSILEGRAIIENPISVAVDLRALASSEDPIKTALLRIEGEIAAIRSSVDKLESKSRPSVWTTISDSFRDHSGTSDTDDLVIRMSRDGVASVNPVSGWTDERVEVLKTMWESGASASAIAKQLGGLSRNAVIGKVHRLGLGPQIDDELRSKQP